MQTDTCTVCRGKGTVPGSERDLVNGPGPDQPCGNCSGSGKVAKQ